MLRNLIVGLCVVGIVAVTAPSAKADTINLVEVGASVNGTTYSNLSGIDIFTAGPTVTTTGFGLDGESGFLSPIGTVTVTLGTPGTYDVLSFLDAFIGTDDNNEYGTSIGSPALGQSWEIGDSFHLVDGEAVSGDIYQHVFTDHVLANGNTMQPFFPDVPGFGDVALAFGWTGSLATQQIVTIQFVSSATAPDGLFYLTHLDRDSNDAIYYWSTSTVSSFDSQVPEPASLVMLGTGLLAAAGLGFRRRKQA